MHNTNTLPHVQYYNYIHEPHFIATPPQERRLTLLKPCTKVFPSIRLRATPRIYCAIKTYVILFSRTNPSRSANTSSISDLIYIHTNRYTLWRHNLSSMKISAYVFQVEVELDTDNPLHIVHRFQIAVCVYIPS